ncbi:unnamed protein product [Cyclocybe aegerita]|uniref:Zn(2)-C6 fungal-type domain-containing protein n=1 Tax=Cyclocybe aegerita TaxID=1973307 RepID=A0A8S0WDN1_CYCAE|nr:unnamed protein product [Cyclocybe aegerita]
MAPTCATCKKRKVKCDGQTPMCTPCASRRQSTSPCDYNITRQPHSPSDLLPRGDACMPCRRKKKKCNGERPVCRTCVVAKKEDGCVYNDNSAPNLLTTLVERNRELERLLGAVCWPSGSLPYQQWSGAVPIPGEMDSTTNAGSPESIWSASASIVGESSTIFDWPLPAPDCTPATSAPSSPTLVAFSPQNSLSAPMSPQISCLPKSLESQEDYLDLRQAFLQNGIVLGQSSTREKWQALYMCDTSCSIVHPALIHVAHVFGARILNRWRPHMAPIDEEPHLNGALMMLSMPPMTRSDAVAHIQCYCLLAVHFMKGPDLATGREWLLRADTIVRQFDLHIVPPPEGYRRGSARHYLSEDCPFRDLVADGEDDERRDALCQLLYIDSVCALRMRLPTIISPQLRQEFDVLMQHYMTQMKEASIVVLRMASIALLQEARMVMNNGLSLGSPPLPSNRSVPTPFASTIRRIHLYLTDLNELILAVPPSPSNRPWYVMLQQCTLVPGTALASIYHLLASSHPESQRKCIDAIAEVVSISDALSPDDCGQLDPIVSVCWSITLNISMQIQQQIVERNLREPGCYSGVQMGQVPAFIEALQTCARKVKWPFPLTGGMALHI